MPNIISKKTYAYNDLTIVPKMSNINSRSQCNPFTKDSNYESLPLFTAPMDSVVNEDNIKTWEANHIIPILPRTIKYEKRLKWMFDGKWVAMSLVEFKDTFVENSEYFSNDSLKGVSLYVCIDVANGHMKAMYDAIKHAKELMQNLYFIDLHIMVGNIANPNSYAEIAIQFYGYVDYIRLSIGSGNGCLTTSNTGVHYPIASLIYETKLQKISLESNMDNSGAFPKIIADGGVRNYSDVIKALALGADYVMIGSLFSSFLESASTLITMLPNKNLISGFEKIVVNSENLGFDLYATDSNTESLKREMLNRFDKGQLVKEFYGMSTKKAQAKINANTINKTTLPLKTSEGCIKKLNCEYTMAQWVENMISYLRSAMSYTDCDTIEKFNNNVTLIPNSMNEIMAVNK